MQEKHAKDRIDAALAKTYFRDNPKNKNLKLPVDRKPGSFGRMKSTAFLAFSVLVLIGAIFMSSRIFKSSSTLPETNIPGASSKKYTAALPVSTLKTEKVLYNFERDEEGWEIPSWALDKADHVGRTLNTSAAIASEGKKSLELYSEFPGGMWTASLVEIQHYLDLSAYDVISADIYLPPDAPEGLRAKLILTVGENWKFVEMTRSVKLEPGKWTSITAKITEGSTDWKRTQVDQAFKFDVRKVALRIESNMKPVYSGPVYIDNISVGTLEESGN